MTNKKIIFYLVLIFSIKTFSQTGPGGVGANDGTSNLSLWLDSFRGVNLNVNNVTSWQDQSGFGNNAIPPSAVARPVRVLSDVNNYPSIDFDGTNDELRVTDDASIDLTQWSIFIVTKADLNKNYNSLYGKGNDANENYEFLSFDNGLFHTPIKFTDNTRNALNTPTNQYSVTNFDIFEYSFSSIGRDIYKNNLLLRTDNQNKTPQTNNFDLYIGNERNTTGRFLNGRISEVIFFNQRLNLAQRIITSNYLAAKYNRTLTANDFYNEDTSGGNFDHKVAGIGQATNGTNHTDSKGTGIVRMNTPNNLANDEYLFWGEDVINANYSFSTVPLSTTRLRLDTKWRVSERGDVGTVTFSVNESDLNLTNIKGGLKLIRSTVSDFSAIAQEYDLTLTGGIYSATVSFNDNDYFTLEVLAASDLSLTKTVDKAIPKVGETVIFTLTLTNSGPQDATGVLVRDLLPTGLAYNVSLSTIASGTYNATTGDWDLSGVTIANGSSVSIQIAATVNASGVILNTSEVISLDQEDPDANSGNGN